MTLLIFLLVLSILVLAHELGHFLVAKRAGIKVEEFGLGIPPRLFGKTIKGTIYSVNALPFGGFVRLAGEDEATSTLPQKRQFIFQSKTTKAAILTAGVIMNLLLAFISFSLIYSVSGIPVQKDQVKIVDIAKHSPAEISGLKADDIVFAIDKQPIKSITEFTQVVDNKKGQTITLQISRAGEQKSLSLTPRASPPEGEGPLGVVVSQMDIVYPPLWQRPFIGAWFGFREALFWGWATLAGLVKLFTDLFGQGVVPKDLAGPVGIYQLTGFAAQAGWLGVVNFIGILSVNLAIVNILPFPALDGGRLLFVILEKFRGRPVSVRLEQTIHVAGMVILLSLIFAITINDILRLTSAASLGELFSRIFPR